MTIPKAQLASARASAYAVLADLVSRGVSNDNYELAACSPRLERLLRERSREDLAAEHFHVFDFIAPAFEGLFLDPEARTGSTASQRLEQMLRELGIADIESTVELESLGAQLELLSRSSASEAAALAAGRHEDHDLACEASLRILDEHLLQWILVYEAAVARCGREFPIALLAEVVDLALDHRTDIAADIAAPQWHALADSRLDLDDPDTDLRDIARALTRPAVCGALLTRDDLQWFGRNARVPRGFGARTLELLNLFRNASELGALSQVVAGIEAVLEQQERHFQERLRLFAPLRPLFAPWQERLADTRRALHTLTDAARASAMVG